jgi:hypothetical protein
MLILRHFASDWALNRVESNAPLQQGQNSQENALLEEHGDILPVRTYNAQLNPFDSNFATRFPDILYSPK